MTRKEFYIVFIAQVGHSMLMLSLKTIIIFHGECNNITLGSRIMAGKMSKRYKKSYIT